MDSDTKFLKAVAIIGDKHALGVIHVLLKGDERFCEIERYLKLNPITLTNRLRKLEVAGLVWRTAGSFNKLSVVYGLTDRGRSLRTVIASIEAAAKQF